MGSKALPGREVFARKLQKHMPPETLRLVMLAYRLSKYGHMLKKRDGGDRYFEHPKRVALVLLDELNVSDSEMIIAALLHDIKEDSFILEWWDIEFFFGERVRNLVQILTKEKKGDKPFLEREYIAKLRKAQRDARLIKLADRLDNLRDLGGCLPEKQERILEETMRFYLPLARRTNRYLFTQIAEECQKRKNRTP